MRYAVISSGTRLHRPSCQFVTDAEAGLVRLLSLAQARRWLAEGVRRDLCGTCKPSFAIDVSL